VSESVAPSTAGTVAKRRVVRRRLIGVVFVLLVAAVAVITSGGGKRAVQPPKRGVGGAKGRVLWVSGRYNCVVDAISTQTGRLLAKIPVGQGPHGLCVWPQPGRYSLGYTGILR